MSNDYQSGPGQPHGWGYGQGPQGGPYGYGLGPGPGPRRVDLLDVLEGVMQDGLSLSNLGRIARASGSKFWLGAAIGAGVVVLARKPELREVVSHVFHKPGQEG
ncbi:hypothetical protein E3U26_01690 [Paracoccus ferrooxidans]|nr:hypothetical protein E3U26_01690 [Paracoccus ferrooxidans]